MIKALIVDDEIAAAGSLQLLLNKCIPDITVVGIARSIEEAKQRALVLLPDIVFLDIEMPGGSGFDFLEQCSSRKFEVIFTTAYESYAVKAFKYSAVDYLLKPIGVDELIRAVEKATARLNSQFDSRKKYSALFENIKSILPRKLVVTINNSNEYIDLGEVTYFEAQSRGADVYKTDLSSIHIDDKLMDLLQILDRKKFFKINSSQVVNTAKVLRVKKNDVELSNGVSLKLDQSLRKELVEYVERTINQ